jgi:hypothetical protein
MPVCLLAASVIVRGLERVDHGVEQAKQLERDEDCDLIEPMTTCPRSSLVRSTISLQAKLGFI